MATTKWFNPEKTVLIHRFDGEWTNQDYRQSVRKANQLLSEVDYKVTHFLDMTNSQGVPKGFMSALYHSAKQWHSNSERIVIIGANPRIIALIRFYNKIYTNTESNTFIVDTIAEALGAIGQQPISKIS